MFEDTVPKAFKVVLNYIYTDSICLHKINTNVDLKETVLLLIDVYHLATDFKMKRLEQLSLNYFLKFLNLSNVIAALRYAVLKNQISIKDICVSFIAKESNYSQIFKNFKAEYELLYKSIIIEIAEKNLKNKENSPQSVQLDNPVAGKFLFYHIF